MDSTMWFWLGLCGLAVMVIALIIFLLLAVSRFSGRGWLGFLSFLASSSKNERREQPPIQTTPLNPLPDIERHAQAEYDQQVAAQLAARQQMQGGFTPLTPTAGAQAAGQPPPMVITPGQQNAQPVNPPHIAGFPAPNAPHSPPVVRTPSKEPPPVPRESLTPRQDREERPRPRDREGDDLLGAFYEDDRHDGDGIF